MTCTIVRWINLFNHSIAVHSTWRISLSLYVLWFLLRHPKYGEFFSCTNRERERELVDSMRLYTYIGTKNELHTITHQFGIAWYEYTAEWYEAFVETRETHSEKTRSDVENSCSKRYRTTGANWKSIVCSWVNVVGGKIFDYTDWFVFDMLQNLWCIVYSKILSHYIN